MLAFDNLLQSFLTASMTQEERNQFHNTALDIILRGDMTHFNGPIFKEWCKGQSYNSDQALMAYSTAFPQRLLIAVVSWDNQ
jgi:hypothetical protein